jgi:uncharacterized membrane protein
MYFCRERAGPSASIGWINCWFWSEMASHMPGWGSMGGVMCFGMVLWAVLAMAIIVLLVRTASEAVQLGARRGHRRSEDEGGPDGTGT